MPVWWRNPRFDKNPVAPLKGRGFGGHDVGVTGHLASRHTRFSPHSFVIPSEARNLLLARS